jgi:hypothetical protein
MAYGLPPGPVNDLGGLLRVDDGTLARSETPSPVPLDVAAKGGSAKPTAATIAERVVTFARRNLGDRVGDGECFALVDQALRRAGAKSASHFGEITPDADYVWGTPVSRTDVQPGDILQFRDFVLDVVVTGPDGTSTERQTRPHHTAIVESIASDGAVTVLEQNVPRRAPVHRARLYVASATTTSGDTTTTVTVSGDVWIYRPEPR